MTVYDNDGKLISTFCFLFLLVIGKAQESKQATMKSICRRQEVNESSLSQF